MRLIGHLENESNARLFGDYLYVQGVENEVEFIKGEGWGIWVNAEEKLESAAKMLADFRSDPGNAKYQTEARNAEEIRAKKASGDEAWRKRIKSRRHLFRPLTGYSFGPLSFALIVISVIVFFRSGFAHNLEAIQTLFITRWLEADSYIPPDFSLPEIRHGQIWRLFTPMFIHFNILHIFFNMLWLRDLGSMIEGRQSSWHLAVLTLIIAAVSNLAQLYVGRAPSFGGMSGVVYGLLGYVWIRGKFDPGSGLYLHRSTVTMMLIWLVACFTGVMGTIANYAHLAGLILGMAWGWISSLRYR